MTSRSSAAALDLKGNWKLVVCAYADDEFAVIEFQTQNGAPTAIVKDAHKEVLPSATVEKIEQKGDSVTVALKGERATMSFNGTLVAKGPFAGQIVGALRIGTRLFPARLQRTDAEKTAPLTDGPIAQAVRAASAERDPKARIAKLKEELAAHPHHGANYLVYNAIVASQVEAGAKPDEVRAYMNQWLEETKPFGDEWLREVKGSMLLIFARKGTYPELAFSLATDLDKAYAETGTTEQKAEVLGYLVKAAKALGKKDIAAKAEQRSNELEAQLDAEYEKAVPPFKPSLYSGRAAENQDRVVLVELFTGAECPPCVAADVAFDALVKSYKPTEVLALQYHEHIPQPDPLTNEDTLDRKQYYSVQGTPSAFFNGKGTRPGGGPMQLSKMLYDQYRDVIGVALADRKRASIDLQAKRSGDQIQITAKAEASPNADGKEKKVDAKGENGKLRLRLALVEDTVRFAGGNKLRFHHHVVRAMPGGPEGIAFKDGRGEADVSVKLSDVKKAINAYLDSFEKDFPFPKGRPPLDLKNLSVVAYVQDDADKSVLHAVTVPVDGEK
jgi:thiol-disulfide isomerase/thioredoxin